MQHNEQDAADGARGANPPVHTPLAIDDGQTQKRHNTSNTPRQQFRADHRSTRQGNS